MEARHHLHTAGDIDAANQVTESICSELDNWGAWDQEISLIHGTLAWLAADHPRRPEWYRQLGILAQNRGDYDEAERRYHQSVDINKRLGNQAGAAHTYGQLGNLAMDRGDYDEAERRYRQSLDTFKQLGNQAGAATSYHQLGILAQSRGNYDEAERRYHQSVDVLVVGAADRADVYAHVYAALGGSPHIGARCSIYAGCCS